ncbi:E3 ubiquitin-protein ligase TRIM36-like [Saccostrea cucullata]|uniref:E3 ubiquitin-protein ligase TRIM36-like n=1 Tax=Saccostrea cuccullata TaxID=36930 RepID=UPI002ED1D7AF
MCKAQHEAQHLSNPHEIIDMTSDKGGSLELLHCPSHKEKRLQFYCNREACLEEVCPDCVIEKHNGHKVEKLGEVYNQIRAKLQKESNEIDTELLPKYEKLLRKEDAKISRVSKRIDEVQKQMEAHANKIVGKVTAIKEKRVQDLQKEKEKALKSIEATKNTLEKNIEQLRGIKTQLDQKIDARPCTAFLNAGKNKRLTEMEEFPKDIEYTLDNFRAGDIETIVQENHFGTSPQITQTIQPENLKNVKEIIP